MTRASLPESASPDEARALARRRGTGLSAGRSASVGSSSAQIAAADRIRIQGLEVFANHGVESAENRLGQKFIVSAVLYLDLRQAGRTDRLEATVNYAEICRSVDTFLRAHTFKLIEAAAEALAAVLLQEHPLLVGVRLTIEKPWAPIGLPLQTVSVEIERTR